MGKKPWFKKQENGQRVERISKGGREKDYLRVETWSAIYSAVSSYCEPPGRDIEMDRHGQRSVDFLWQVGSMRAPWKRRI